MIIGFLGSQGCVVKNYLGGFVVGNLAGDILGESERGVDKMSGFVGGCDCGNIRYEASGEPVRTQICHCDDCRRSGGSAFATNVFVNAEDFRLIKGEPCEYFWNANSGNRRGRAFCRDCGSSLYVWNEARPHLRGIRIGTIDDASFVKPWAHVWVSRALPSTNLSDELEKFEEQGP
jgi:hypothetical protein